VKYNTRERVVTDDEIKNIWEYDYRPFSIFLKLLLLTSQRRGQFQYFRQSWVNDDVIVFPAEVMKTRNSHTPTNAPCGFPSATTPAF